MTIPLSLFNFRGLSFFFSFVLVTSFSIISTSVLSQNYFELPMKNQLFGGYKADCFQNNATCYYQECNTHLFDIDGTGINEIIDINNDGKGTIDGDCTNKTELIDNYNNYNNFKHYRTA